MLLGGTRPNQNNPVLPPRVKLRKCEIFLFAHVCIKMTMRINDSDADDLAVAGESLPLKHP